MNTMITINDNVTVEDGCRCEHATRRQAEVYAAQQTLASDGWTITPPSSIEGFRLPLLLEGERFFQLLDGSRSDERATGFTATRSGSVIRVDATVGEPLLYLLVCTENGDDVSACLNTIHRFLGQDPR